MANIQLLLVDDEERFLETTQRLLKKRDITTYTATNGLDALKLLDDHRLDVAILDVKMPGLDGVEVLRRMKKKHALVEVIMLTGHASVESAVEGLKLGAFDYLVKPCDISALVEKVKEAYAKKQGMEEKIRKAKIDKIIKHPLSVFEKD
ncbi:MAG: response regulator [Deltaproteobacteria bacterium]|nr:response regulator [Deltaproteobacteria bacterium]